MNEIIKDDNLKIEIKKLRQMLNKEIYKSDHLDYKILSVSQELDILITRYRQTK